MTDPSRGTTFKRRQIAGTFLQPSPEHPTRPSLPASRPARGCAPLAPGWKRGHPSSVRDAAAALLRGVSGTRRLLWCYSSQPTTPQLLVRLPVNRTGCFAAGYAGGAKPIMWWSCNPPSLPAGGATEICLNCSSNTGLSQSRDLIHSARHVMFNIPEELQNARGGNT